MRINMVNIFCIYCHSKELIGIIFLVAFNTIIIFGLYIYFFSVDFVGRTSS